MIAIALGAAWALLVGAMAGGRGTPIRVPGHRRATAGHADPGAAADGDATRRVGATDGHRWARVPATVGSMARRLAHRPPDAAADRRAGLTILATGLLAMAAPPLSALPIAWAAVAPAMAARRAARAHDAAVVDQLPDVVDLVALTTDAGLPVTVAFGAIGSRPGGPLGSAFAAAGALSARGGTAAEALALVAHTAGPAARPLVDALAEHDRYGTPLRPALQRVAIEARLRRRRLAEEAARRLPITLLFPLVLTTLPAFVALTVIPLLAGSLGSLSP